MLQFTVFLQYFKKKKKKRTVLIELYGKERYDTISGRYIIIARCNAWTKKKKKLNRKILKK